MDEEKKLNVLPKNKKLFICSKIQHHFGGVACFTTQAVSVSRWETVRDSL